MSDEIQNKVAYSQLCVLASNSLRNVSKWFVSSPGFQVLGDPHGASTPILHVDFTVVLLILSLR